MAKSKKHKKWRNRANSWRKMQKMVFEKFSRMEDGRENINGKVLNNGLALFKRSVI